MIDSKFNETFDLHCILCLMSYVIIMVTLGFKMQLLSETEEF